MHVVTYAITQLVHIIVVVEVDISYRKTRGTVQVCTTIYLYPSYLFCN